MMFLQCMCGDCVERLNPIVPYPDLFTTVQRRPLFPVESADVVTQTNVGRQWT